MPENMPEAMQGDTSVLKKFFAHNAWANLKLLDFCAGLSDEQLDAEIAVGGYGPIRKTLLHIIRAEIGYVKRVNGKLPDLPFVPDQFPSFDVLKAGASWASDELLLLAVSTRDETLVREEWEGGKMSYSLASLMVQAITHSVEHRAQIAATITQLGLEPPDMSVWIYVEESGELQETRTAA